MIQQNVHLLGSPNWYDVLQYKIRYFKTFLSVFHTVESTVWLPTFFKIPYFGVYLFSLTIKRDKEKGLSIRQKLEKKPFLNISVPFTSEMIAMPLFFAIKLGFSVFILEKEVAIHFLFCVGNKLYMI